MTYTRKARGWFEENDKVCRNGHPRTESNTETRWGCRRCKLCMRARSREYDRRRGPHRGKREQTILPSNIQAAHQMLLDDANDPRIASLLREVRIHT